MTGRIAMFERVSAAARSMSHTQFGTAGHAVSSLVRRRARRLLLPAVSLALVLTGPAAHAVPSFARQTGQACEACHVGAFGPQLTAFGARFKLGGYTLTNGKSTLPIAAMAVAGFTNTRKSQAEAPADRFSRNDNVALQELSGFIAGKLAEHVGSFAQVTYSGIDRKVHLDNVDLRIAAALDGAPAPLTVGMSINNNPSVQDGLFNALPAWRFPFTSSELAPSPAAAPLLDGALEQQVYGVNGYLFTATGLYAELGLYDSFSKRFLEAVNADVGRKLSSPAPYLRAGYLKDRGNDAFSLGIVGMTARLRDFEAGGPSDKFEDIGVDATYQYLGDRRHVFSLGVTALHERQSLDATFAGGGAARQRLDLNETALTASYYFDRTYGLSARLFDVNGSRDGVLYPLTGKPDSSGVNLQLDWTPWGKTGSPTAPNVRLGLQYTLYRKFDGAKRNIDGDGRDARDNDTLFAFVWVAM